MPINSTSSMRYNDQKKIGGHKKARSIHGHLSMEQLKQLSKVKDLKYSPMLTDIVHIWFDTFCYANISLFLRNFMSLDRFEFSKLGKCSF